MVQFHTHEIPTATKAEAEAGVRDDIALSPASLFGANLPILVPPSPGVWVSDTPPEDPYDGMLWWESDTGTLWAWYIDPDSAQWVQISGGTGSKSSVIIADSAPEDAENGQLWWHSGNGNLYCWYIDPSGPPGQWVQVNTSGGIYTPQMFGAAGDGTTDDTAAFRAAAAAGVDLYIPFGNYVLKDMVTVPTRVRWQGADRLRSRFIIPASFNMSALGVFKLDGTNESGSLCDIGITFVQNTNETVRANATHYPPAIYAVDATRIYLDNIRISGAWDGINASGNTGGTYIGRIEIGALNCGLLLDNALDFIHGDSWMFWCFGFAGTPMYTSIYSDGTTRACRIGKVDGLGIDKVACFNAIFEFIASAASIGSSSIGMLQLDSNCARLIHNGHSLIIDQLVTGKSNGTFGPDIENQSGRLAINYMWYIGSTNGPVIQNTATFMLNGGYLNQGYTDQNFLRSIGGTCEIRNCLLVPPASARTAPFIKVTNGQFRMMNCTVEPSGGSGVLLEIDTDNYHMVTNNSFGAFTFNIPPPATSTLMYGVYGPNRLPQISFLPTVTFATPGDFVPTYAAQNGRLWHETTGIRFQIRLQFDTNAFTTAAGQFRIGGLPFTTANLNHTSVTIGSVNKVDFTAGYTSLMALAVNSTGAISIAQMGDNIGQIDLGIANIKPSTTAIILSLSGFIPTR